MTVDFVGSEPHLVDHLRPVWDALPPEHRGSFFLPGPFVEPLADTIPGGSVLHPDKRGGPVVGCQWGDIQALRHHRRVGLMEHGAGATYPERNPAFAGGTDRERIALFLAPNEHVRAANAEHYPHTPNVVVGTPWLDQWFDGTRQRPDPADKCLVLSWHWDMRRWHGGRSALDHHLPGLRQAADELRGDGWTVLGTAHPRAWNKPPNAAAAYDRAGIDTITDFADVLDRATVMACDVSSSAWLSAAAGCAQIVLEAPWYAKAWEDRVWPRFDPHQPLGPLVKDPAEIPAMARAAHAGLGQHPASVAEVVPHRDGRSAQRAADAIVEHLL